MVPLGRPGESAAVEGAGLFRIETDGLVEVLECLIMLLLEEPDDAAADKGICSFGVEFDGLGKVLDCLVVLLLGAPGIAAAMEGRGFGRKTADVLVEIIDG